MAPGTAFLADLTVALIAAAIGGAIAARLRLNPILGYLLAGIAIGPFTPGYVANGSTIDALATIGLIFLLFSLGLGFSFGEIRSLGAPALLGNLIAMVVVSAGAFVGARALDSPHAVTFALATAVSSTAVGAALLRNWNIERAAAGRFALAQLIVQDLVAVALLVLTTAPAGALTAVGIALSVVKAIGFVAVALLIGEVVLARVVRQILHRASAEALFGTFAALALAAAWLGQFAGLGFEFGAFVAGAVISEAAGSRMVTSVVAPFRALFVALFFVSIGMLLDLDWLRAHAVAVVELGLGLVVVRAFAWSALARFAGSPAGAALMAGTAMTALGEFNVVIAKEAHAAHRLNDNEGQLLLGVTIFSIVVTVAAGPLLPKLRNRGARLPVPELPESACPAPLVAILGYGRVGSTVGAVLDRAGIPFVALETDRDALRTAEPGGERVIYGDGIDPAALDAVLAPTVRVVLSTIPDAAANASVVRRIAGRTGAQVLARAEASGHVAELLRAGATTALVPEIEGALGFAHAVLRALDVDDQTAETLLEAQRSAIRAASL